LSIIAADWFTEYHDVNATQAWVQGLVAQYSSLATLQIVGQSYEGRTIQVVKVSGKPAQNKTAIFYDGGIHAR
jgi:murein tripeptide amidase MpaA